MLRPLAILSAAFVWVWVWARAGAAHTQTLPAPPDTSWAERMMERPRQLGLEAELNALDARLRAEQNLATLQAQSQPLRPAPVPEAPGVVPPLAPTVQPVWPAIPDAALAASRARVQAILSERR